MRYQGLRRGVFIRLIGSHARRAGNHAKNSALDLNRVAAWVVELYDESDQVSASDRAGGLRGSHQWDGTGKQLAFEGFAIGESFAVELRKEKGLLVEVAQGQGIEEQRIARQSLVRDRPAN